MGVFGKKKDGEEDSNRLALFGSRNKSKSPAPPTNNPYAQTTAPPDPYTQAKMSAGIIRQPEMGAGPGGPGGPIRGSYQQQQPYGQQSFRGDNSYGGGNDSRYGAPPSQQPPQQQGYGADRFGNEKGYGAGSNGSNPYASNNSGNPYANFSQTSGTSKHGSYGGLGRTISNETASTDMNRDALFGGARERIEQRPQQGGPPGYAYNNAGGSTDPSQDRSYGAYGDRQLTAEEEEEEDIQAIKQDIRFMKQQDVSSTRNALRAAAAIEESGRNTLARLGAQGERLHNTNKNLDLANNHINIAEDKSKELKTLNRSMFAVHVNNPFTAKQRLAEKDRKITERHQDERVQREMTREAAFRDHQRMNQTFKKASEKQVGSGGKPGGANLAERAKYQFDADSEDEAMEDELDRNLQEIQQRAQGFHIVADAMNEEIRSQNEIIQSIGVKSDRIDDRVHLQTERLKRIK